MAEANPQFVKWLNNTKHSYLPYNLLTSDFPAIQSSGVEIYFEIHLIMMGIYPFVLFRANRYFHRQSRSQSRSRIRQEAAERGQESGHPPESQGPAHRLSPRPPTLPGRPQDVQRHQNTGGQIPGAFQLQSTSWSPAGRQQHQVCHQVGWEAHGGGHFQCQRHRSGKWTCTKLATSQCWSLSLCNVSSKGKP